jgi:hypothetical protein
LSVACRTNFSAECEEGTLSCACFENGTCNEGLTCTSEVCVEGEGSTADESGADSQAGTDDTTDSNSEVGTGDGDGDGDASASGDGDATASGDGDTTATGDGDGDGTGDGDGDGDGTGDGDGDGDGDGTGDGDGDGEELFPANGLDITVVEFNQGVAVSVGSGPDWVAAAAREARLIGGRETLVRVHHDVHADWIPREVEAQLEIQRQDQSTVTYTDRRQIFNDSLPGDLQSGFSFVLDCNLGDCDPGVDYQVTLWDIDTPGSESPGVHTNPATGLGVVGFENLNLEMRLVFVPIDHK